MAYMSQICSFGIANRMTRALGFLLISSLFVSVAVQPAAAQKQKLEKGYKEWLERDVAYIITKDERNTFLRLTSDATRDQFIQNFWEIRNPTPGSPENQY